MSEPKQIGQFHAVVIQNLPEMTAEQRQICIKNPMGVQKFLLGLVEAAAAMISFITHTFTVLVDETLSVEEAVKLGNFNWVNDNIVSANFPSPKDGKKSEQELFLFHFNKVMSSEAVIAEMDKAGYEPATIWDLLGLAVKEPNLQRQFPIVALKSVWRNPSGYRSVPCLCGNAGGRSLLLSFLEDDWLGSYRFLARRKCQK